MMYGTQAIAPNTATGWSLDPIIDEMLQSHQVEGVGKISRTLVKGKDLTVVLTVLPKGHELKEHKAPASVMVVPLRGEVRFDCEGEQHIVGIEASRSLSLGHNQPHAVSALSDSAFLLVIGPLNQLAQS